MKPALLLLGCLLASCADPVDARPDFVGITPAVATIDIGETLAFTIEHAPAGARLELGLTDSSVVRFVGERTVAGTAPGTTRVIARVGSAADSAEVTVRAGACLLVHELTPRTASAPVGTAVQYQVYFCGSVVTQEFAFTSSDTTVAGIDAAARATARAPGRAVLTAIRKSDPGYRVTAVLDVLLSE